MLPVPRGGRVLLGLFGRGDRVLGRGFGLGGGVLRGSAPLVGFGEFGLRLGDSASGIGPGGLQLGGHGRRVGHGVQLPDHTTQRRGEFRHQQPDPIGQLLGPTMRCGRGLTPNRFRHGDG